jgi:hypothetical protein
MAGRNQIKLPAHESTLLTKGQRSPIPGWMIEVFYWRLKPHDGLVDGYVFVVSTNGDDVDDVYRLPSSS